MCPPVSPAGYWPRNSAGNPPPRAVRPPRRGRICLPRGPAGRTARHSVRFVQISGGVQDACPIRRQGPATGWPQAKAISTSCALAAATAPGRSCGFAGFVTGWSSSGRASIRKQRLRVPVMGPEFAPSRVDPVERRSMVQVKPFRIRAFRLKQLGAGGQRRLRFLNGNERVSGNLFRWYGLIHDLVHEGRVRAVFQQAPHEIGQKIAMRAHRVRKSGSACCFDP